jgi:rare lipoprotein A
VSRRTRRPKPSPRVAAAVLIAGTALLAAPAAALAGGDSSSGGAGLTGGSSNPLVRPANEPVSTSGDGLTLQTVASGETKRALAFSGTAPASDAGRVVDLQRAAGAGPDPSWSVFATSRIGPGGDFGAVWRATQGGQFEIEAVLATSSATGVTETSPDGGAAIGGSGAPTTATSDATSTTPTTPPAAGPATAPLTVSIYESGVATLYGPGLYGRRTACGETLRRTTLGVASRSLACGTHISVLFRGRAIVVPVIDRGPYANGADWDLTMATARALGIRTTVTIGALQLAGT